MLVQIELEKNIDKKREYESKVRTAENDDKRECIYEVEMNNLSIRNPKYRKYRV